MYGIHKCSGSCLYCSAASTMNYNEDGNKNTFKFDKGKTKKRILDFTEIEKELKNGNSVTLHIDIWGGNPLENFNEFRQVVEFCQTDLKEFKQIRLHTSGNGLELRDNEKVQYLIDNNIHYQLSHDGCGQFIRTGIIDPLYWDKTKDNIVKLTRLGILDWINTTLNARNYSFFENMEFWNKWRRENDLMGCTSKPKALTIKLNHIYPGTPAITKKWIFDDYKTEYKYVVAPKKGEEIGDLNFHGEILNTYIHEFIMMGLMCRMPEIEKSQEWIPFLSYLKGQTERSSRTGGEKAGICRQFQMGTVDKTFAIDTIGEYCQCNLIDSSSKVKNPDGVRSKECETCEFKDFDECFPCGSEIMPLHCEYMKEHVRSILRFEQLDLLISKIKNNNCNFIQEQIISEPIYCVKNYTI